MRKTNSGERLSVRLGDRAHRHLEQRVVVRPGSNVKGHGIPFELEVEERALIASGQNSGSVATSLER